MPEASFMLLSGQWATPQPAPAMRSISASSSQTQWAKSPGVENAQLRQAGDGAQTLVGHGLIPFETVSAACTWNNTPSSLAARLAAVRVVSPQV